MSAIDPRIVAGTRAMLALRRARLDAGERAIGWKLGFGAPAAFELLGTDRPLVGFLTDAGLLDAPATAAVAGWTKPMLEGEIAVVIGADIGAAPGPDEVRAAIAGLAPAIELADLDPPPADVRAILAGNIFHRHVLVGPVDGARRDAGGLTARIRCDGVEVAQTADPTRLTGPLLDIVASAAGTLAACGERLRAGDVLITGSVTPPLPVAPGQRVEVDLGALGTVAVDLT